MFGLLSEDTGIHETEYHYEVKMREYIGNILQKIDTEIDEIDLYGYDIIETSLSMVHKLQTVVDDLRTKIQTHVFDNKEDEILFFKTQKPEILSRLLFFYKIYRIETQCH